MRPTACSFCGVPVARGTSRPPGGPARARVDLEAVVCEDCWTLEPARPGATLRAAARVAGGGEGNDFLLVAVAEDDAALDGLLFSDPAEPLRSAGRVPGKPWAHVPASTRAALAAAMERAYQAWLAADRGDEAAGEGPPPAGPAGCLVCGIGSAPWWRRVLTAALTRGPSHVEGYLCSSCSAAHDVVRSVGPSLVERAWRRSPEVDWPEGLTPPPLRPWVATGRPPGRPWSWVDVRPPDPDPTAAELAAEVAELRTELAALRAGRRA